MSFGVSLSSQLPASVTKRIYSAALFARPVFSASWRSQYAMRQKLFSLSRYGREDMWRRFKQIDDRRVAERLHAILLLDSGQNADAVSSPSITSILRPSSALSKPLLLAAKTRSPVSSMSAAMAG